MENNLLKQQLRARMKALRLALSAPERATATLNIATNLVALSAYQTARTVLGYCGDTARGEIESWHMLKTLLESGKILGLPRVVGAVADGKMQLQKVANLQQLQRSKFGILEPLSTAPILDLAAFDLIIVPGLAFDCKGNRLGAGGGFYDRLLAANSHAVTVALAFDCQLVEAVPVEAHDASVNFIITESQTIDCKT